ncbi:MAG: YkgJ family cysteine cluster protein [Planctomycetota bacterium]|nr:hypothetical protein [Psychrobacter sp.]MDP6739847.1 YkgJ family cysteine cluster protein [Planctomycetota bacterium]MDP6937932.1 YkgJ family cysteine cluster protein [Planctomycetota bacterium]
MSHPQVDPKSERAAPDPGLEGVVPFRFGCQRSGRCCTFGEGHVWLEDGEVDALASVLGMEPAVFAARHVRQVPDPKSGHLRTSLRDDQGRCDLLEGTRECTVYEQRPVHCRTFPYWPSVLSDPGGFESARAVCPGIAVVVPEELRQRAFAGLEALYAELEVELNALSPRCEMSGLCCRFEEADHDLYATGLETDFTADRHPRAPAPEAPGRCPYHVGGRCQARQGRPLGCRTYYCDDSKQEDLEALHESYLGRVRELESSLGYPASYGLFPAMAGARGIGRGGEGAA